jgi:hypothetical protein
MPKMIVSVAMTITNNKKLSALNFQKQSQTNPILPAFAGKIAPLFRMPFYSKGGIKS